MVADTTSIDFTRLLISRAPLKASVNESWKFFAGFVVPLELVVTESDLHCIHGGGTFLAGIVQKEVQVVNTSSKWIPAQLVAAVLIMC